MAKSTWQGADTFVQRASFLTLAVVAFAAVLALSEIPSVARGEASWLTYGRAELIAAALLGVSIAGPIMAYGSAAFSRRPNPSSTANSDDSAAPNPPVERQPVARWLVVLLVLLAVGRCSR